MKSFVLWLTLAIAALSTFAGSARADDGQTNAHPIDLPYCPPTPVDPNAPPEPEPTPRPVLAPEPAIPPPAPARVQATPDYYQNASLWRKVANSQPWTSTVISLAQSRRRNLEQARDLETFCPGYAKATDAQRNICWLRLVGSIAEFESSFLPYERPFCEGNAVYSVGLLALSTGECPNALTIELLQDPQANLTCGVTRMANLIQRDHFIAGPDNSGAGAYWSTLRPPHQAQLSNGHTVTLGKQDEVIARTRLFSRF